MIYYRSIAVSYDRRYECRVLLSALLLVSIACGRFSGSSSHNGLPESTNKIVITPSSGAAASVTIGKDTVPSKSIISVAPGLQLYPQDPINFARLAQSSIGNQGPTFVIATSILENPASSFQIQIPLPILPTKLEDLPTLVILYKIVDYSKNEIREGVLPRSKFAVQGNNALFPFAYFGQFQAVFTEIPVPLQKELVVNTPILGGDGKVVIAVPTPSPAPTSQTSSLSPNSSGGVAKDVAADVSTVTPTDNVATPANNANGNGSSGVGTPSPLTKELFSVVTGNSKLGDISISITWSNDTSQDSKAEVRAHSGGSAPKDTCDDHNDWIVMTVTDFAAVQGGQTLVTWSTSGGGDYSFRLCIFGTDGAVRSSEVVTKVQAFKPVTNQSGQSKNGDI